MKNNLSFLNVKAHGFKQATNVAITGVTTSVSDPAQLWGMTQPFFNDGRWNVSPRNTGDFQGTWTKYSF